MKSNKAKKPEAAWGQAIGSWSCASMLLIAGLSNLYLPFVPVSGSEMATNSTGAPNNVSTTIIVESSQTQSPTNKSVITRSNGVQARAATSYLASRAATGLHLKNKPSTKPAGALGDSVGLDTALESQIDLQTAAGEHGKYILVKKKPKHKKIKMEIYKPKMKYKKIKMKVPVKKMKKKKVKGYLVKKEKHHYD